MVSEQCVVNMNGVRNIRNLEGLISTSLKSKEKIESSEISILTSPGENFGSIVLRIVIKIKNTQIEKYRTIDAVGKIIPESLKVQEVLNTQVTFRNEYKFYSSIIPLLSKFLGKKGILADTNFTAQFLGGRINLNNNEEVDTDAIILMQNLKSIGYKTGNKTEGLDRQSSKIVIDSLVRFHTAGLAFKIQEPKSFEENLRPYFSEYVPEKDFLQMVKNNLYFALQKNNFTEAELEKVAAAMNRDGHKKGISEVWGTMIHYDTWTNNLMIFYKENTPVHSKIVDFQDFGYGTPLNDFMFFLLTSVNTNTLEQNLDDLLEYYYEKFIQNLEDLKVDKENYSKDSFEHEVKSAVKYYEYCHAIWMLIPIMNEDLKSMEELHNEGVRNWNEKHVQKIVQITRLCIKREWL